MSDAPSQPGCLELEVAARYVDRELGDAERALVEEHIDGCEPCRELVSAIVRSHSDALPMDDVDDVDHDALDGSVLPRGTNVGPFVIEQPLDAGGMGLVYTAKDTRLGRKVALKGLRRAHGDREQLLREARTMAQLAHPNVVAVYDVVDAHGQIFLAMELVVGQSLRQWLDAKPRTWKEIVDAFLAAGAGLAAAHAAGVVHGDIKPSNLLHGEDGRVRVTDFGLSSNEASGDRPKAAAGTPAYMAPAQLRGVPCDALGDQYAFCASLHEALFGALPGIAATRTARVPRSVRRVLARGLAAEAHARYPSMQQLLRGLRATRSHRTRWAVAAVAVVGAAAVVAYGSAEKRMQARLCRASAEALSNPWTEELRYAVQMSFRTADVPYAPAALTRVEANLDRWASSFDGARHQLCDSGWLGRDVPPERFAAQLQCLQDHAEQAKALISVLRGQLSAASVRSAITATSALAPVAQCQAPAAPSRTNLGALTPNRRQLGPRLARSRALINTGRSKEALPLSAELLRDAEATGDPVAIAPALVMYGANLLSASRHDDAATVLARALRVSDSIPDDLLRAQAWVNLLENEYRRGRHREVVLLQQPALGAAERIDDVYLTSQARIVAGAALTQLGQLGEAAELVEQALAARRKAYGPADNRVAAALAALGNTYAMSGDLGRGIPAHLEAARITEADLGAAHPDVATAHGNLASDYLYGLDRDRALDHAQRAFDIMSAAHGGQSLLSISALTTLGEAQLEAGKLEDARSTLEKACALWQAHGPKHPSRALALLGRYRARRALGQPSATAELEEALELAKSLPPFLRAGVELELGRAVGGTRGLALLDAADQGFATSKLPKVERDRATIAPAKHELAQPRGAP